MDMLTSRALLCTVTLWLAVATGCSASTRYRTVVEGQLKPGYFNFVTVIDKADPGPGGWRTACIHLNISRKTGESYICVFSLEVPIETEAKGVLVIADVQRKAARYGNVAARVAFAPTAPGTPLGLACESFRRTYRAMIEQALLGSRVINYCREE